MYSFSQVQTYLKCPLQYKYKYIDEIVPPREESLELILGKSVHQTLEFLYQQVSIFQVPGLDTVLKEFDQKFNSLVANTSFEDDKIWIFKNRWRIYITNHYQRNHPFEWFKVLSTEEFFNFKLPNSHTFRGYIDRLDKNGNTLIINDYKTNKSLPTDEDQMYDEQIILYSYGILQKYGEQFDKVVGKLEYLHFDYIKEIDVSPNALEQVVKKYTDIVDEIEHKKTLFRQGDENAFEPKESSLCRFCPYKEICPLFAHWMGKVGGEELGKESIASMVDEYVANANKIKELKNHNDQLKKILVEYASKNKFLRLFGKQYQIKIHTRKDFRIVDKDWLKSVLEKLDLLSEALEIDRYKVAKMIKSGKVDLKLLKDIVEESEVVTLRGGERE